MFGNKYFITVIFLFMTAYAVKAEIILQPYLQAMTPTSAYLLIESDSQSEIRVLYGKDENTSMFHNTNYFIKTTSKTPTYVHRIELDRLEPNTKYFYRVLQEGMDTPLESFTTPAENEHIKVAVAGDSRSNPKIWKKTIDSIAAKNPNILVLTGDIAATPKYSSWKKEFFIPAFLNFAKSTAFVNATGNHEGWNTNTKAFLQAPASPSGRQEYFSFAIGNALFVVLNNQFKINKGSPQYKFCEKVLKESDKQWKIVIFHRSAYVGGGHGEYTPMKLLAKNLFKKYGVTLALSGHSHFYQRNSVDGVYHLTVAGGGAPLYSPKKKEYTQKSSRKHHYAIFEINNNILNFTAYDLDGNIIDKFDIKK
jgi:predicted phosphodiesterase